MSDSRPYNPNLSYFPQPFQEGPERTYPKPGDIPYEDVWSKVDSIRWGDVALIQVNPPAGLAVPINFSSGISRQLINVHVPRPLAWLLQFEAHTVNIPAGAIGDITVGYQLTIGAGGGQTTFVGPQIVLTNASGYAAPIPPPQMFLPASDIQVTATFSITTDVPGLHIVQASCFAAPWTAIAVAPGALR